jgi:hypothetical protein
MTSMTDLLLVGMVVGLIWLAGLALKVWFVMDSIRQRKKQAKAWHDEVSRFRGYAKVDNPPESSNN